MGKGWGKIIIINNNNNDAIKKLHVQSPLEEGAGKRGRNKKSFDS